MSAACVLLGIVLIALFLRADLRDADPRDPEDYR